MELTMNRILLNGDWHYSLEDEPSFSAEAFDHLYWKKMIVPSNWFLTGIDHHGVVWYRTTFEYDERDKVYPVLCFEGVDYFADVFLNGQELGHHEGFFDPFCFEISEIVKQGKNVLAVRVDSPYEETGDNAWHMRKELLKGVLNHHDCRPGGGWESMGQSFNTGGIWNDVFIKLEREVECREMRLKADFSKETPCLIADVEILNRGTAQAMSLTLGCCPDNFEQDHTWSFQESVNLIIGMNKVVLSLPVPGVCQWQPWDRGFPYLYNITLRISNLAQSELLKHSEIFGFRTITINEKYLWKVNGEGYFPRGSNYIASQWLSELTHQEVAANPDHPFKHDNVFEDANSWFERDVQLMKEANLNLIRVHAHVLPKAFYEVCDRFGMMVWQDFPLQWGYTDSDGFQKEALQQAESMVKLYFNHPSIVIWNCHNESPWDAEWMAEESRTIYDPKHNRVLDELLERKIKTIDDTRYVHRNSGTGDTHIYPGWYFGQWQDYDRTEEVSEGYFPTEYGAQGLPGKRSLQRMFANLGEDAGFNQLIAFKDWWDLNGRPRFFKDVEIPGELQSAFEVWQRWRFHDFQPPETFENERVKIGTSLDDFIESSQYYQCWLIKYGTETYRRNKYSRVSGILHFMFTDPWPAITWAVLDYWRRPKPAFETLKEVMQPILPCAIGYLDNESSKPFRFQVCVVNDTVKDYKGLIYCWRIKNEDKVLVRAGEMEISVGRDSISAYRHVCADGLSTGNYLLELEIRSEQGVVLGINHYPINIL
jgi:beta-mannosidase